MNLWPAIAAIHDQVLAHLPAPRFRISFEVGNRLGDGSEPIATVRVTDTAHDASAIQTFAGRDTHDIDCHGSAERFAANVAHALRRELATQRRSKPAKPRRKSHARTH